MLQVASEN
jgi:hypothetical protein